MTIRHYATIGSVSTGTLRTEDLLEAFASELEDHVRANKRCHGLGLPAKRRLIREAYAIDPESDEADDVLADLQEALNDFAPPYTYFGTLEGDGADFGFWPEPSLGVQDALAPRLEAGEPTPEGFRGDCVLINDHGNMTVGHVNGRGKFVAYWACV